MVRSRRGRSVGQKLVTLLIEISMLMILLALVAPQYFKDVLRIFSAIFAYLP